jgi:predicted NBD/HSP70 family sugar kinase
MRIGIDLGGTKIEVVALSSDGTELLRSRVATPQGDYAATVAAVAGLVATAAQKVGAGDTVAGVGIGIPGAESKATGLIKNANSTCLIGRPLRRDLEAALGRPVRIMNDANCFALSEARDGAAAGAEVVFGVILGTGVGGGIVVRGHVLAGANGIAGEWGHNPMPGENDWPPTLTAFAAPLGGAHVALGRPGGDIRPLCYCGRKGCIELYLSGPGMAREHRRVTSADFLPEEIVARAAAGDADCEATLQLHEARLARALATVINIVDPDVIVLGGGLSNIGRLYDNVPALWGTHVFSDRVDTRLVKAKFGDSSGVRGAAWLWNE